MKKKLFVVLLLFLTLFIVSGCNSKKKAEEEEEIDALGLYSDSKKLVYQSSNTRYVFYYEGEQITGYHLYIEYETEELAKSSMEDYISPDDDSMDKIYTKDNYVVIEFNESQYSYLSVSSVKSTYSPMKEIKKKSKKKK